MAALVCSAYFSRQTHEFFEYFVTIVRSLESIPPGAEIRFCRFPLNGPKRTSRDRAWGALPGYHYR
jgi:hypothetical protein